MRLWKDSAETVPVVWFKADPGAKFYPGRHHFGSLVWEDDAETRTKPKNSGVGEQSSPRPRFKQAANDDGLRGRKACGSAAAFEHGGVHGVDPPLTIGPNGQPVCCSVAWTAEGGEVEGGTGFAGQLWSMQGGEVEGGTGWYQLAEGGEVEGGTGWEIEVPFSGCRVYRSTNQTVASATDVVLSFDSERYDTDSYHSPSSNPTRMTAPSSAKYHLGAACRINLPSTGTVARLWLRLNGTTDLAYQGLGVQSAAQDNAWLNVSCDYELSAGDYVEALVRVSSGGSATAIAAGNYSPEAWMHRLP